MIVARQKTNTGNFKNTTCETGCSRAQELRESRGGRPGLSPSLTVVLVSDVGVKQH